MKEMDKKMSPETCMSAGKCLMKDMMDKMGDMPPKEEYLNMPEDEKDKIDEKDVMDKKEDEKQP
uniref:Uncharacterized protein n=1 Tax=viral metagenome TaxID=1070528 RepID=A0A6M3KGQ9_9ZZZZ